MEEVSIKISIANREYPLKISTAEEESVRRAADLVNARMKSLEDNYAVRDKQDLLAMCALQLASELNPEVEEKWSSVHQRISELDRIVEGYLSEE